MDKFILIINVNCRLLCLTLNTQMKYCMRKILTLAMLSAFALAANAQTEKGKIIVGGSIGYSNNKNNRDTFDSKQTGFTLLPSAGYFIEDNLALGLGIGYSGVTVTSNDKSKFLLRQKNKTDYFMVSPFIRHYVNISDQFKFFSQLSVPMQWGNVKNEVSSGNPTVSYVPGSSYKTTSIGVSIAPGLAYFPTKRIGIQLSVDGLAYFWNKSENKTNSFNNDVKSNSFNLGTDFFAPKIGIQFYL